MEEETGRRYNLADTWSPNPRPNLTFEFRGVAPPAYGWRYTRQRMNHFYKEGRLVQASGTWKLKRYLDESKGVPISDVWTDVSQIRGYASSAEAQGFPTQKPEALLERLLLSSSRPGDVVLDCFIGSGTTAAVAQRLGRRWIGCDINKGAIQTSAKRLQDIIEEQTASGEQIEDTDATPAPAQLSFTTWRVNDYDLQIQHNEAVTLACAHLGVERSRTERFFDGTLGKSLVKIAAFDHPLSPVDLEEIERELEARPDEDRNISVVCMGAELAAQATVEEWNRLRRGKNAVNRIEIIELRSDERYGQFFTHEPAAADVRIELVDDSIEVEIGRFVSPSIVTRLSQQTGVAQPRIDDWRAMVDSVMIDTAYDGKVFTVRSSDIPERKSDLIRGSYTLEFPKRRKKTVVAVKITDMLGEEVLITEALAR